MRSLKISCCILCYNYGRFLREAINSCLDQEPGDFESQVLIIDDGSTDETLDVCESFGTRIRVIRSGNEGFGSSLTKAIAMSDGDYVCLLDADDRFAPNKLALISKYANAGALLIYNAILTMDEAGCIQDVPPRRGGNTSTVTVHRETAAALLPVENELSFNSIRATEQFVQLEQPLTFYRRHSNSMSQSQVPGKWASDLSLICRRLSDRLTRGSSLPWMPSPSTQLQWGHLYRSQACYHELEAALERGQRIQSLRACAGMLRYAITSPFGISAWHIKMIVKTIIGRASFPKALHC
jgi:hypothetical protein